MSERIAEAGAFLACPAKANHTLIQSQRFSKSSHNLDGISVWPRALQWR